MEIRIRIPTSLSALRYMFKNPKSVIIGIYNRKRYQKIRYSMMIWASKFHKEELAHELTRQKLIEARKELSALKRNK